jgi:hypothetical protein
MGVVGQRHAPIALPLGKKPGAKCIGGWVVPMSRLGMCRKSRSHRNLIPGLPSPYPVAIPTELSRPLIKTDRLI